MQRTPEAPQVSENDNTGAAGIALTPTDFREETSQSGVHEMESERILLTRRWALGIMLVSAVMPQLAFGQAAQDAASNQME